MASICLPSINLFITWKKFRMLDIEVSWDFSEYLMHFKEANNFDLKWNVPVFYKCLQNLTKKFQILDTEVDWGFKKILSHLKKQTTIIENGICLPSINLFITCKKFQMLGIEVSWNFSENLMPFKEANHFDSEGI